MKRRSKYGAVRTTVDGITFDSKGEAAYWQQLRLLERGRKIDGLQRQVVFPLVVNGMKVGKYTADFTYTENGHKRVVDYKGCDDTASKLRRKLVKAIHGIDVELVGPAAMRPLRAAVGGRVG